MLVLASASPRRQETLRKLGLAFQARPTNVDETPPPGMRPRDVARTLARRKLDACKTGPGEWALAADTLIELNGVVIGQPRDDADAKAILARLAGKTHQVHTAVALRTPAGKVHEATASAQVTFAKMRPEDIAAYVATGEPRGKAGAYAVQGGAAAFIERLEGDVGTVVGLPTTTTLRLLSGAGFPLPHTTGSG